MDSKHDQVQYTRAFLGELLRGVADRLTEASAASKQPIGASGRPEAL